MQTFLFMDFHNILLELCNTCSAKISAEVSAEISAEIPQKFVCRISAEISAHAFDKNFN